MQEGCSCDRRKIREYAPLTWDSELLPLPAPAKAG